MEVTTTNEDDDDKGEPRTWTVNLTAKADQAMKKLRERTGLSTADLVRQAMSDLYRKYFGKGM